MNDVWNRGEDNLFSANHRNSMIQHHKGTMAQIYTVEQIEREHQERSDYATR
jgi:hypothetical protein